MCLCEPLFCLHEEFTPASVPSEACRSAPVTCGYRTQPSSSRPGGVHQRWLDFTRSHGLLRGCERACGAVILILMEDT